MTARKPTIAACRPLGDDQNTMTVGPRGPALLKNHWLLRGVCARHWASRSETGQGTDGGWKTPAVPLPLAIDKQLSRP